jgi:hypothetical protein
LERREGRRGQDLLEELEHRADSVSVWSKEKDPGVASRRVGTKIREAFVSRNQEPPLLLDGLPKDGIFPPAHSLVSYRGYVFISRFAEESGHGMRQVFIDLETHPPSPAQADSGRRLSWCRTSAA